ncbi:IS3 family transposase [Jeotgalibaca caeni]|uniref:IS3 family transposase n=1 Tax=Jeotgalibaca caeni TaxID=3028623 RepID=UPI00237DC64A|nr:IS3 family transposase [Jeotgalibaca caeni]MDE1550067.1 IS3 family transposase [Jeotgalibaca caeni]
MGKNVYSSEVKWAVIKDKMGGELTNKEIMEKYGIKNKTQIQTWMRWYRGNQVHRLTQPIGKQYSYGHGPEWKTEEEKKNSQMAQLKMENEILKKVFGTERGVEKGVVLRLVEQFRRNYTIKAILAALGVARSTYYRWKKEPEKMLSEAEEKIIALCQGNKYRYGHRKITKLLKRKFKIKLHRNTVQRIMQRMNLQCRVKPKRKWKSQGETTIVAPDLLKRNFMASKPDEKWVTDITYVQYGPETLYLSTIMDLYNNEIVAYKLYDHQQTSLVLDTLEAALEARGNPTGVILHSDQGSVYTSYAFQRLIKEENLVSSMSRRGNCWDNAVIESFHSNIKSEEFQFVKYHALSISEVICRVQDYLHYYNHERIQEKLGYQSPLEYRGLAA